MVLMRVVQGNELEGDEERMRHSPFSTSLSAYTCAQRKKHHGARSPSCHRRPRCSRQEACANEVSHTLTRRSFLWLINKLIQILAYSLPVESVAQAWKERD